MAESAGQHTSGVPAFQGRVTRCGALSAHTQGHNNSHLFGDNSVQSATDIPRGRGAPSRLAMRSSTRQEGVWWIGHARMLAHEGDGESCPCCLEEFWSPLATAVIVTRIPMSLPRLALGPRSICRERNPVRELSAIQGRSREPQRQQQRDPQRCLLR